MPRINPTSFTYNPRKPLFGQLRAQLPTSCKSLRAELPEWFANLVSKGVISRGIVRGIKTDPSILPRFQKILEISEFSVNDAGEIIFQAELVSSEVNQLLAGKPETGETALEIFFIESRLIFTTVEEYKLFRSFPNISTFPRDVGISYIASPPVTRRNIFPMEPDNIGVITEGIIPKKVRPDGRIEIRKNQKIYLQPYFPKGALPSVVNISISGENISILDSQGDVVFSFKTNYPDGLGTTKPNSYLRRFGQTIKGYFFTKVKPDGTINVAGTTLRYPRRVGEVLKITFDYGRVTIYDLMGDPYIDRFRLKQKVKDFHGDERIVHHDGSFQYQRKTLYLDRTYAGEQIRIYENAGRITKIEKLNGEEIPLSALRITYFYSPDGNLQEIMPVWNHFSFKRLGGRTGFHLIGQRNEGAVSYFGKPYSVAGEYPLIAAVMEQGKICGFRYFNNELANPADPPDHETFRKRVYLGDNRLLLAFGDLKGNDADRIFAEEAVKITHWQVPRSGRIMIKGKNFSLHEFVGKWAIILLDTKTGKATCRIYDYPEIDPTKAALREKTISI